MNLNVEFVISATIIIFSLLPLYIYRKKIFKFANFGNGEFKLFAKDLKVYLIQNYPKIKFDFSILDKTNNESNLRTREIIIVENMVNQFFYYKYEKRTQNPVAKEKLWSTYDEKSASNSKYPQDWPQRKELVWTRENKCCNRCGNKISYLKDAYTQFVKEIEDGGGYNVENVILICQDCNQVLNSKNPKNTMVSLNIYEKLMIFVKS